MSPDLGGYRRWRWIEKRIGAHDFLSIDENTKLAERSLLFLHVERFVGRKLSGHTGRYESLTGSNVAVTNQDFMHAINLSGLRPVIAENARSISLSQVAEPAP